MTRIPESTLRHIVMYALAQPGSLEVIAAMTLELAAADKLRLASILLEEQLIVLAVMTAKRALQEIELAQALAAL